MKSTTWLVYTNTSLLFVLCVICHVLLQYVFSMFLRVGETYRLIEQLANMAMRQLMLEGGFQEDKTILDRTK